MLKMRPPRWNRSASTFQRIGCEKRKKGDKRIAIDRSRRPQQPGCRLHPHRAAWSMVRTEWHLPDLCCVAVGFSQFDCQYSHRPPRKPVWADAIAQDALTRGNLRDARDRRSEAAAVPAARPVWSQMKQNAAAASTDKAGGMVQLAQHLAKLAAAFPDMEVHLIGHSAGSVVLGSFLGATEDEEAFGRHRRALCTGLYP